MSLDEIGLSIKSKRENVTIHVHDTQSNNDDQIDQEEDYSIMEPTSQFERDR